MEEPAQAEAPVEIENKEAKSTSEAGKVEYFPKYTALLNQVKDHLGPNAYKNVFTPTNIIHFTNKLLVKIFIFEWKIFKHNLELYLTWLRKK